MGTWGTGLYGGDFAADLRTTARAVLRLPLGADRLVQILAETEPGAARNPEDEDHTTFWLVVADQFARHGLKSAQVVETALRIIASGQDLDVQRQLGQSAGGLKKRSLVLAELHDRIVAAPSGVARKVLREPQKFVMNVGDIFTYPTCGGQCRNPYVLNLDRLKIYGPSGGQVWSPDGWGAAVIVARGHTFGYLAWYRPVVLEQASETQLDMASLRTAEWLLEPPGTCSKTHFGRIGLNRIGTTALDETKLLTEFGALPPGDAQAIADISIANSLNARSRRPGQSVQREQRAVRIGDLAN
jgi:hypothetical protein